MEKLSLNHFVWLLATLCKNYDLDGMAYRALLQETTTASINAGIAFTRLREEAEPATRAQYAALLAGLESGNDVRQLLESFLEQRGPIPDPPQ